jgi:hypothetical protein
MTLSVLRNNLISAFLLRGLVRGEGGMPVSLPPKGCVSMSEIIEINPLDVCEKFSYPPAYQIIRTDDKVFGASHATTLHAALKKLGVESMAVVAPGMEHASEIWAEVGDKMDVEILSPAVSWVAGFAA